MKTTIFYLLILVLLVSCQPEKFEPIETGPEPLKIEIIGSMADFSYLNSGSADVLFITNLNGVETTQSIKVNIAPGENLTFYSQDILIENSDNLTFKTKTSSYSGFYIRLELSVPGKLQKVVDLKEDCYLNLKRSDQNLFGFEIY